MKLRCTKGWCTGVDREPYSIKPEPNTMRTSIFLLFIGSLVFTACTDSQAGNTSSNAASTSTGVAVKGIVIPAFPERTAQLGDPAEAEQRRTTYATLQQKLRADPNDRKSWIKLTELFITEARITGNFGSTYDAALTILDDLLEKTKTSSPANNEIRGEALTLKALIMLSQHQFKEALALGQEAIKLDPYRAFNYGVLVDAHVELGHYAAAVQLSDRMVAIRPDLRSYSRVSYIRELHGDIPGAIAAMDMAVKAGYPGFEDTSWARVMLGRLFENKGDLKKAEEQYMAAITERRNYPPGMVAMGRMEMKKGNYEKAEQYLVDAIQLMPDAHAFMELARTYEAAGRTAERDQASAKAEEILLGLAGGPGDTHPHSHGADGHSHSDGVEHHHHNAVDHGHSHEVGLEMGRYELEFHNDLPTALMHASHEHGIRPDNIDVNGLLASIHYANGNIEKADEHLQKALRTGIKDTQLMCLAGLIAMKKGDKTTGRKLIKEALALDPYQQHPFLEEAKQAQRS